MQFSDEDITSGLIEILGRFPDEPREIGPDTDIVADLGLDSPQVMDLLLEVEDRFDISVPLNVLPDVHTIADLAAQIRKLLESSQ